MILLIGSLLVSILGSDADGNDSGDEWRMSRQSKIPQDLAQRRVEWIGCVNAGDVEKYADLVSEDVVWLAPGREAIVGRRAFQKWMSPFMKGFSYEFSTFGEEIVVSADSASESGSFLSMVTPRTGGDTLEHRGAYMLSWRKEKDGVWRIERYADVADSSSGISR